MTSGLLILHICHQSWSGRFWLVIWAFLFWRVRTASMSFFDDSLYSNAKPLYSFSSGNVYNSSVSCTYIVSNAIWLTAMQFALKRNVCLEKKLQFALHLDPFTDQKTLYIDALSYIVYILDLTLEIHKVDMLYCSYQMPPSRVRGSLFICCYSWNSRVQL